MEYDVFRNRRWTRPAAYVLSAVLAVSAVTLPETRIFVQAKTVNRTGYTLSKAAGTYQDKVRVKITAKKGYKVYYSLNGALSIKKLVKSGASKTVTIKKTKTLSIYAVKSQKKVKKAALQTKAVLKKIKTYRYVVQKTVTAEASVAVTSSAEPTAGAAVTAEPTAGAAVTAEPTASATVTAEPTVGVSAETEHIIDFSSTDGKKISDSDTGYTYKKSKKNKLQIMTPGTYKITGAGGTYDGLIIVDFGEKYDADGDGTDDTSYETSKDAKAGSVTIILDDITLTDTNADFDINTVSEMTSDDGLIKIKSSDYLTKVKITVKNRVSLKDTGVTGKDKDDAEDTTYPSAILSKKTPLEIEGSGTLTVSSLNGNGIKSTSSLRIEEVTIKAGTADIPLGHNGITAKTELETKNADISIYSVKDGLKTTYDSDDNKNQESPFEPLLKVTGGTLLIESSDGDGISASYTLNQGTTEEKSYGKAVLAPDSATIRTKAANEDSSTADDAVHSNGDITMTGGTLMLSAADDGIHADGTLTIQNGAITVTSSYEGLEGNDILISGGTISVTATDDGLNAAGGSDSGNSSQDSFMGNPFGGSGGESGGNSRWTNSQNQTVSSASEGSYKGIKAGSSIMISGGEITVDTLSTGTKSNRMDGGMMNMSDTNHSLTISGGRLTVFAEGDGIDSNGSLYISGGTVVVYGPSNGGNGALDIGDDSSCVFEITGGTLWAFAGTSDMAVTPTKASPGFVSFTTSTVAKGNTLEIQDSTFGTIDSITLQKVAAHVIYYGENLSEGSKYTLSSGASSLASAEAAAVSQGGNGMFGGNPFDRNSFGGNPFGGNPPGDRGGEKGWVR